MPLKDAESIKIRNALGQIDSENPLSTGITGTNGDQAEVNSDGQLHTVMRGKIDTGNSTTSNLTADEVFTGSAVDTLDFATMTISVHSDQASAVGGLEIQYSVDAADWHDGEVYTILAGADKFFTPTLQGKYMRIIYTNGPTPTTDFHIHTTLRKSVIKPSSHNIDDSIKDEDDAELVKAVITGKRTDGIFDNVHLTNGANMKVSLEEFDTSFNSNPLPVAMTSTSLALQLDEAGSGITYVGEAPIASATSAGVWRIKRLDESGDPELIIKWADGDASFDNIWDNRASLTYN